jgi:hypothetical protein
LFFDSCQAHQQLPAACVYNCHPSLHLVQALPGCGLHLSNYPSQRASHCFHRLRLRWRLLRLWLRLLLGLRLRWQLWLRLLRLRLLLALLGISLRLQRLRRWLSQRQLRLLLALLGRWWLQCGGLLPWPRQLSSTWLSLWRLRGGL